MPVSLSRQRHHAAALFEKLKDEEQKEHIGQPLAVRTRLLSSIPAALTGAAAESGAGGEAG